MRRFALLPVILLSGGLSGCMSESHYATTVDAYVAAASHIELGMSPHEVARILEPSQAQLANHDRLRSERYLQGDTEVEIQFYRSGWQADGRISDEEYTPYLFHDGELVAIGWQTLRMPEHRRGTKTVQIIGLVDQTSPFEREY